MKINSRGYWEDVSPENHGHDEGLGIALVAFFQKEKANTVFDIGCGDGWYTHFLNEHGILTVGFDGNPDTSSFAGNGCYHLDFSVPLSPVFPANWVLSLEVGEHIPAEFEGTFIDNIARYCSKGVVISWSIPEYGGEGHVNPQSNEYICEKFTKKGFILDESATETLRNSAAEYPTPCYWFRKTLMVFRRR